jgi:cyclophilin family peptidyl-prolyl cis-trans isomerase
VFDRNTVFFRMEYNPSMRTFILKTLAVVSFALPVFASAESPLKPMMLTGEHEVILHTSKGDITLELDADKAPKTVTNFVSLAKSGYYDGLTFHRVINNFMIQGGDPTGDGTGGESIYGKTFEDEENNFEMKRGMIAMANRGPDTNGSQFFIVHAQEAPWLTGRHTIFGRVTKGMDVVDAIAAVRTNGYDAPLTPITYKVEVKEGNAALTPRQIARNRQKELFQTLRAKMLERRARRLAD